MSGHFELNRRRWLAAAGALAATPSWAQGGAYPTRPIKIIIPIQAGGIVDTTMRLVADRMSGFLGQPVMIDNRPGGNYVIAVAAAAAAPADGYTLLGYHQGIIVTQAVMRQYSIQDTFTQIALTGDLPNVVAVKADSPFRTLTDLIEYGKANPGKLNYATPGTGSIEHLTSLEFEGAAGFSSVHVPVRGGPDMVLSLLRGDCQFSVMPIGLAVPYASKGQVRYLAMVADERDPLYPTVPSMKELGLKVRPLAPWMGLAVRKGVPDAVVQRIHAEANRAMQVPDIRDRLAQLSVRPVTAPAPIDLESRVRSDVKWFSTMVASANLKLN